MTKTYKDLREFLATLEEEGQLVRIKEEVMPEPDIGAAGRACANMKEKPAVFFRFQRPIYNACTAHPVILEQLI